ncbi:MAG TPA: inorganic phosphate transporter [Polyangia bacterium]|jgi:PiT family inorganic phosphate transporter|nr:inorganic phosphate transporter [Polyangia bacterium]
MLIIVAIVVIALVFDYINGFHDAANSIATIVSTRVLTPRQAVVWAGFFNFIAFTVFPLHVAHTIGKGIIDPKIITDAVLLGALGGAIAWNLITWWYGLPSSSSHALVGGLLGAGISKGGFAVVQQSGVLKTAIFIVVSPVLGMVLGGGMMVLVAWVFRRKQPGRIDRWFRRLQLVSSALFSLGHGANDAQKTMGIIMAMLIAKGKIGPHAELPLWVILSCQSAMGLGTLTGGWRIVRTMGMRLTKLKPSGGFCAETGAALTLFMASALGVPVSTTHTITGGIVGVGWVNKPAGVRWAVALRIVWAWLFTIQSAALIAAGLYFGLRALGI